MASQSAPWSQQALDAYHCVRICLNWAEEGAGKTSGVIFDLEARFWDALGQHGEEYPHPDRGVGAYCGKDWITHLAVMVLYGRDADRLLDVVMPILRQVPLPAGSYLVKRFGGPDAREERINLC
jgi:hypothetical protein